MNIRQVADELSRRLTRIFLRDAEGRRAVAGEHAPLQNDPHFRDYPLFHEYFDGDTGRGVGAAHQCGWTGLVAKLLMRRPVGEEAESVITRARQPVAPPRPARKRGSPVLSS